MEHNDLKKGTLVMMPGLFGQGPRTGKLMDNLKGITRMVHIDATNGHYPDMGSVYVDEIEAYWSDEEEDWRPVHMSSAHRQKMAKARDAMRRLFG